MDPADEDRVGFDMDEDEEMRMWGGGPGIGWRVVVSIISFFGLLVFIVLWLFFWAGSGFNVYQNLAVIIVAILIFFAIQAATWASMMMGHRRW